jgi:hypothetical protein
MPTGEGSGFDDLVVRSWQAANTDKL